jgi:hypothetical protein
MPNRTQPKFLVEEAFSGLVLGALCGCAAVAPIAYFFPAHVMQVLGLGMVLPGLYAAWIMGTHPQEWHVSGMEFLHDIARSIKELQADENGMMSVDQARAAVAGVKLGEVQLSRRRETAHLLLVGLPGGGKTVLINNLLLQILDRGDRAVIHDPKGEFAAWLPQEGTVLLGPWDARAMLWDIAADISNPESARTFMEALMMAGMADAGQNRFFYDTARDLGAGLVQYYQRVRPGAWGFHDLLHDIAGSPLDLVKKAVLGNPALQSAFHGIIGAGKPNVTENSVLATFRNGVAFIQTYALAFPADAPKFSVRDFLRGHDAGGTPVTHKRLVLNNNAQYGTAAKAIFGGVLSVAAQMAASADMPEISADEPGTWFVLDEFPQMGQAASASIQTIEEMGRSRGVRVLKAMQDYSQVYQQAGKEKGSAQLRVQQTRLFCKVAPETASEISSMLDKRKVARIQNLTLTGSNRKSIQLVDDLAVRPVDLMDLKAPTPDKKGIEFVMMKDARIGKLLQLFPAAERVKPHSPAYVERAAWVSGLLEFAGRQESPPKPAAEKEAPKAFKLEFDEASNEAKNNAIIDRKIDILMQRMAADLAKLPAAEKVAASKKYMMLLAELEAQRNKAAEQITQDEGDL